jgi:hypothetical protein
VEVLKKMKQRKRSRVQKTRVVGWIQRQKRVRQWKKRNRPLPKKIVPKVVIKIRASGSSSSGSGCLEENNAKEKISVQISMHKSRV